MKSLNRIIAFGDSLTAGAQSPTRENPMGASTPYGEFLQQLLGGSVEVQVRGINGELTTEMVMRFGRDVLSLKPDYVMILGGTNDLGWNTPPQEIMRNLVTMYERARRAGLTPVAITVPSIRGLDELIHPRHVLNNLILEYAQAHSQPIVDLFIATAEAESLRLDEVYSNDGLHLSTIGYQLLADLLYRDVFKSLVNQSSL